MHFTIVPTHLYMFYLKWPELVDSRYQVCMSECEKLQTLNVVGSCVSGPVFSVPTFEFD